MPQVGVSGKEGRQFPSPIGFVKKPLNRPNNDFCPLLQGLFLSRSRRSQRRRGLPAVLPRQYSARDDPKGIPNPGTEPRYPNGMCVTATVFGAGNLANNPGMVLRPLQFRSASTARSLFSANLLTDSNPLTDSNVRGRIGSRFSRMPRRLAMMVFRIARLGHT
jgi:hypothetical protein